jgi:hypothetical protein
MLSGYFPVAVLLLMIVENIWALSYRIGGIGVSKVVAEDQGIQYIGVTGRE